MPSIWYISKYCRLPSKEINYSDVFQVEGAFPANAKGGEDTEELAAGTWVREGSEGL